ncbi:MAG: primosomal protein N' [Oscillospiraceae bacterium]|nr:primosomal protein N' [Oscillospiraceae bacterium]
MVKTALVAVENTHAGFDREYRYKIPDGLEASALPGCRCTVPFGGGNKKRTGFILSLSEDGGEAQLKPLSAVIDDTPVLSGEMLFLLRFIRETMFCTWFDALKLLIPAGLGIHYKVLYSRGDLSVTVPPRSAEICDYLAAKRVPVEEKILLGEFGARADDERLLELVRSGAVIKTEDAKQRVSDEKQVMVRVVKDSGYPQSALTKKQRQVYDFILENETASLKEICYYMGVTRAVVDALVKKGGAEYFDHITPRTPYAEKSGVINPQPELSKEQAAAYEGLKALCGSGSAETALLYGVTGSGKTEVFVKLARHVISCGKTVVVLVPEISLTAQAAESFLSRFGSRVAVLHSNLSLGQRMDEWKRIKSGGADIVVGTRSAVFAPFKNIGLIVIDEEQENTYKSDKTPRYHARDVALKRCAYHGAMLLLSSATPSIESFYAAKSGKYKLFTLLKRYNQTLLPDVEIVDMREASNVSAYPALSAPLLEGLHDNLEKGGQSILLLNRRGHSTLVKCASCGAAAGCPNCSVALTYHNANDSLVCHYCSYTKRQGRDLTCAACGSGLVRYAGIGTQKLEEELKIIFPDARILRVDMDTTMSRFSHENLFHAFSSQKYDIMIGTQMVAKGLNFPNVTLVGVLQADQSLYSGDYKSFERTFSLLTQVVGRGGRGDKRGRAVVQTYSPDNPVIEFAALQDYGAFYRQEIKLRKLHLYPPFCTFCAITFSGSDDGGTMRQAIRFTERFKELAAQEYPDIPARLLGPSPAEILKTANKYRYRLVLKCKNNRRTRQLLSRMLEWFLSESKKTGISIDMHY